MIGHCGGLRPIAADRRLCPRPRLPARRPRPRRRAAARNPRPRDRRGPGRDGQGGRDRLRPVRRGAQASPAHRHDRHHRRPQLGTALHPVGAALLAHRRAVGDRHGIARRSPRRATASASPTAPCSASRTSRSTASSSCPARPTASTSARSASTCGSASRPASSCAARAPSSTAASSAPSTSRRSARRCATIGEQAAFRSRINSCGSPSRWPKTPPDTPEPKPAPKPRARRSPAKSTPAKSTGDKPAAASKPAAAKGAAEAALVKALEPGAQAQVGGRQGEERRCARQPTRSAANGARPRSRAAWSRQPVPPRRC